jgi:multiple sugar transport system permease protein
MIHWKSSDAANRLWRLRSSTEKYLFVLPAIVALFLLLIYPLLYTVQMSVSGFDKTTFLPAEFVGLKNFKWVLKNDGFLGSFRTTAVYLLTALPLQMVVGTALAFLLAADWRGSKIVRGLLVLPMVVTPVVAGSVWKQLLDPLWGLVNYIWTTLGGEAINFLADPVLALASIIVIDSWRATPFVVLMVSAGIAGLDREPLEAAKVDGATRWQALVHVTLPMLRPVILSAFVVRWLGAIKLFDIVFTATGGGPGTATEVLNYYVYTYAFQLLNFEKSAAMAVIAVAVAVSITLVLIRISLLKED